MVSAQTPSFTPVLELDALEPGYGAHRVTAPLDTTLETGELTCLLGPNGAGKSTLLRTLCGMQAPVSGKVHIAGQDVHRLPAVERARRIAVVLTDRIEASGIRVHELVAMGRHPHTGWDGRLGTGDLRIVDAALEQTHATALAQRCVGDLSDGERQRVMLARALAQQPTLLVLDEVLAFLDLPRRVHAMSLLRDVARTRDIAIVLSCHDLDLALRWADRLWVLPGDGRLHSGAPEALVLDGTLAAAFQGEGLGFDVMRGEFHLAAPAGAPIRVDGDGLEALWLERAMVRAGRSVATQAEQTVAYADGQWVWKDPHASTHTFPDLHALVRALTGAAAT